MKKILLLLLILSPILTLNAQETTILTIMTNSGSSSGLQAAVDRYQQNHPNVELRIIENVVAGMEASELFSDTEAFLDTWASLASQADVIMVDRYTYNLEITRTGYFLNLQPLISLEPDFEDNIYPAMWESFRWDNGLWGIPTYAGPISLSYSPEAFDEAGITYPDNTWTGSDYINAINALAVETKPAAFFGELDLPLWLRVLSSTDFTSDDPSQTLPDLNNPQLAETLASWVALTETDALTTLPSQDTVLRIRRGLLDNPSGFETILLPGDQTGLYAFGLAVSSGTAHPEQAFELAQFLATAPEFVSGQAYAIPADRTIVQQNENAELWDSLMMNAIPQSVFDAYMLQAWRQASAGIDAATALSNAQSAAEEILALAEARQAQNIVVVPPEAPSTDGETIVLNFGTYTGSSFNPLQGRWEDIAEEFAEESQQTLEIIVTHYEPTQEGFESLQTVTSDMDCLYTVNLSGRANNNLQGFLPLEPLLDADPTFDPVDLLPGTREQVQVNGQTIALPVSIFPTVMYANEALFEEAGLPLPDSITRIEDLAPVLEQLNALIPNQEPYYPASTMGGDHYFMFLAAYGTNPIDMRQSTPVVNFTDPDTVSTIQHVLDMARDGLIYYHPTARYVVHTDRTNHPPALLTHSFRDSGPNPFIAGSDPYQLVLFPYGDGGRPVVNGVVMGIFISAESQYPELCYQFAREIVTHPELHFGIPAYHSVIDSPQTLATRGEKNTAFYQVYADTLSAEDTVFVQQYILDYPQITWWLKRAFDRYVMEDADLESELAQAEQFTREYIDCVERGEEPPIPGYPRCALEIDPSIVETYQSD